MRKPYIGNIALVIFYRYDLDTCSTSVMFNTLVTTTERVVIVGTTESRADLGNHLSGYILSKVRRDDHPLREKVCIKAVPF